MKQYNNIGRLRKEQTHQNLICLFYLDMMEELMKMMDWIEID